MELTYTKLCEEESDKYILIDIRNKVFYDYGHISNSINLTSSELKEKLELFSKDKQVIIYCKDGKESKLISEKFQSNGYNVHSLKGGYISYINDYYLNLDPNEVTKKVEFSISKKFHRVLFSKFAKAINEYELISPGDKIAVCISGGKDSMLMAKLFQELKRHNKFPFELVFLVMDPGYSEANRKLIEKNANLLSIPVKVFESDIFENVFHIEKSPCYVCARMRRGYLYSKAKELGCNKIALGHHYDDVIETILMGMLYGAQIQTMMPKLHSTNFEGMGLIRPMYLIREEDIIRWRDYNGLFFIQCACKFTEKISHQQVNSSAISSKRKKVKDLIAQLKSEDPDIDGHIFKSVENVNLSTIIAYKDKNGIEHNFKDDYD